MITWTIPILVGTLDPKIGTKLQSLGRKNGEENVRVAADTVVRIYENN